MFQNRFIGISIVGWFLIAATLPAAIVGFLAMISHGPPDLHIRFPLFLSPVFLGISGIGILLQKKWARLFAVIISSIVVITLVYNAIQCIQVLSEHPEWTSSNIFLHAYLLLLLYCLFGSYVTLLVLK